MIKTKKGDSARNNTGKKIREVWRNFSTLLRRNKLKLDKRRTILQQTQYIIIFDFFYVDHSILKPGIATQHNILNLVFGGNSDNIQKPHWARHQLCSKKKQNSIVIKFVKRTGKNAIYTNIKRILIQQQALKSTH